MALNRPPPDRGSPPRSGASAARRDRARISPAPGNPGRDRARASPAPGTPGRAGIVVFIGVGEYPAGSAATDLVVLAGMLGELVHDLVPDADVHVVLSPGDGGPALAGRATA